MSTCCMTHLSDIRFIFENWLTIGVKQVKFCMDMCTSNSYLQVCIKYYLRDDSYKPAGSVKLGSISDDHLRQTVSVVICLRAKL